MKSATRFAAILAAVGMALSGHTVDMPASYAIPGDEYIVPDEPWVQCLRCTKVMEGNEQHGHYQTCTRNACARIENS